MEGDGDKFPVMQNHDIEARLRVLELSEANLQGKLSNAMSVHSDAEKRITKLKRKLDEISTEVLKIRKLGKGKKARKNVTSKAGEFAPVVQIRKSKMLNRNCNEDATIFVNDEDAGIAQEDVNKDIV